MSTANSQDSAVSIARVTTMQKRQSVGAALRTHAAALAIGVVFMLLSVFYSITIPAWEADNEISHFNYVRYLVEHRSLPSPNAQIDMPVMVDACRSGEENLQQRLTAQFRQPPLYYLLGAIATFWADADTTGPDAGNPFVLWDPQQLGYNVALHNREAEAMPYTGTLLALHSLRLFSGILALTGLIATYLLGLLVFENQRPLALAMMAVNAFIPQYVFASAIANNDIAVAVFSSWCVLFCAFTALRAPRVRFLFAATLFAGLAISAKYNAVVLLPLVAATALVVFIHSWRAGGRRFGVTVLKFGLVAIVAGFAGLLWFASDPNLQVRLQFLSGRLAQYIEYLAVGFAVRTLPGLGDATRYAFTTFWGQFGWDTLTLPAWGTVVLAAASLLAGIGVALLIVDRRTTRQMRLVVLAASSFFALTVLQAFIRDGGGLEPRGRYLLPAVSTISFLLVAGLFRVLPQRAKLAGVSAAWLGLLALAVATPFLVLAPAYAPPRLEATADLLPGEQPVHAVFGGFAELVGYRAEPQRLVAGEPLEVTLVWRALLQTPHNYTTSIHLLDGNKYPRAWVMSHPGHGNFPTSAWRPGDVFRDSYVLYWSETPWEELPSLGELKVALFCPGSDTVDETHLDVTDAQGVFINDAVYFGRIKVAGASDETALAEARPAGYRFGEELLLQDLRLAADDFVAGENRTIETVWQALRQPDADYALFAHIVDSEGRYVAGNDQPLTDGYYPSGLWEPGEIITHTQRLPIPALQSGEMYTIQIGLYDPITGQRMPLFDPSGQRAPGDSATVAVFQAP
jgi:hypothetical protein